MFLLIFLLGFVASEICTLTDGVVDIIMCEDYIPESATLLSCLCDSKDICDCNPVCLNREQAGGAQMTYSCSTQNSIEDTSNCAKRCFLDLDCEGKPRNNLTLSKYCICTGFNITTTNECFWNGVQTSESLTYQNITVYASKQDFVPPESDPEAFQKRNLFSETQVLPGSNSVIFTSDSDFSVSWTFLNKGGILDCSHYCVWYPPFSTKVTHLLHYEILEKGKIVDTGSTLFTTFNYNHKRSVEAISVVSWSIPNIYITTPSSTTAPINIQWTFLDQSGTFPCLPGICEHEFPMSTFPSSGTLTVNVIIGTSIDLTDTELVTTAQSCQGDDNWWDPFTRFSCKSMGEQMVVVIVVIVLILVAVSLVILMIWIFIKLICCCYGTNPTTVVNNYMGNPDDIPLTKIASDRLSELRSKYGRKMQEEEEEETVKYQRTASGSKPSYALCALLILALVTPSSAQLCTNGLTISAPLTSCLTNGSSMRCSFGIDTLLTLPYKNSVACLSYASPDGSVVGQIFVTYRSMIKRVSLQSNYFTSGWTGVFVSSGACYNSNGCHSGECAAYNNCSTCWPPAGPGNLITGESTLYPGRGICDSQCGCAGCGCFFCDARCIYSRFGIKPIGSTYQVLTPYVTVLEPSINVTIKDATGTKTMIVSMTGNTIFFNNSFSFSIIGSLSGSSTEFGSRKVIVGGAATRIGVASESGSPQRGIPGDIQGASSSSFTSPSPTSFGFAYDIANPQFSSSQTTYQFAAPGTNILTNLQYAQLPATIGSVLYTYSTGQLVGTDSAPGGLIVQFQSSIPINLTRIVNYVCPKIIEVLIDGCYTCITSARLVVKVKSTCSPGIGLASISSAANVTVLAAPVTMNVVETTVLIPFSSGTKYPNGILTICAGAKCDSMPFSGILDDPAFIPLSSDNSGNGTITETSDFSDWWNSLVGAWSWGKYVLITVIAVVVVGAIAFGALMIYFNVQNMYTRV